MSLAALALVVVQAGAPAPGPAASSSPAPAGPVVLLKTSLGEIRIGLYSDKAPNTVDNFVQYVRAGFYDGTIFHRVLPNFMIQGGGLGPDLVEKPTRGKVRSEARNGLRNSRGAVAMARQDDPDSADAQFFINLRNNHALDFGIGGAGYTVFGAVLEGMDVVDRIAAVATTQKGEHEAVPLIPVVIQSATVVEGPRPDASATTQP